jgi:hypothetical protein
MKNNKKLENIIAALATHEDSSSIAVLERLGTNSANDEVRRLTAKALVSKNTNEALAILITQSGKGINDLSTNVAMGTINELLALKNKEEAIKILDETQEAHSDEEIRETARSVKALMAFS